VLSANIEEDQCSLITRRAWIGLSSVLRPRQHSIGYMGDGFYRSKDPTNSIKVLKEDATKENNPENKENTKYTCIHTQNSKQIHQCSKSPSLQ